MSSRLTVYSKFINRYEKKVAVLNAINFKLKLTLFMRSKVFYKYFFSYLYAKKKEMNLMKKADEIPFVKLLLKIFAHKL